MAQFGGFIFRRNMLNRVWHHSIHWLTPCKGYMIALSWAIDKGDWWKSKEEENAKFLRLQWKRKSEEFVRSGIYIGRLAAIIQSRPRNRVR